MPRKSGQDSRGPTETEVQAAVDELKSEMESQEFIDLIDLETVPPPEIIEESTRPMIEASRQGEPSFVTTIGERFICKTYLSSDTSPNDPYYASDALGSSSSIVVVVNRRHPQWSQLGDGRECPDLPPTLCLRRRRRMAVPTDGAGNCPAEHDQGAEGRLA